MEGKGGSLYNIYLLLHCHQQNESCIKMGSDESHLMFHNCEGQNHNTVSKTTTFEVKRELKQIRTEVPLLTSLLPYC